MTVLTSLPAAARQFLTQDAVVGLARALVQVASYTPEGEAEAAAVLERFLQQAGVATERHPVDEVGVNVIARLGGADEPLGLLLNGHLDTVPPSSAMRFPPFAAEVSAGKLWGRGSVDMKGGVAAMACAMAAVHHAGLPLRRSLALAAVACEEQGNQGTAALVQSGLQADAAVVGEPTSLNLVIAHKGVDRYQIIVGGKSAHESLPDQGVNAIVFAARLIDHLSHGLFVEVGRAGHAVLGPATYNIGTIEGGTRRNMVPDRCMFRIAKRWLPGDSPAAIRAELEAAVRSAGLPVPVSVVRERDMQRIAHPPLEIAPGHALTQHLRARAAEVLGRAPALTGWAAFTDGALLQDAGIPTLIFGPGELSLAHTDEEHIPLDQMVAAAEIYAGLALDICGPAA